MANKFITWLENIPTELKKFFTNPVVDNVLVGGLGIVALVEPAWAPLVNGLVASIAKAEALAAAAGVQSGSGAQKLAIATADAQEVFQAYEQATGTEIESTQQTTIINSIVALLNNIPAATPAQQVPTSSVVAAAPTTAGHPVPVVEPAAPSVQQQVASNTLL